MNPLLLVDGYKLHHRNLYPKGTIKVVSNMTARKSRIPGVNHVICFGFQAALAWLEDQMSEHFFSKDKKHVCAEYKTIVEQYTGSTYDISHIEQLHDLGYLPIRVKTIREGMKVPIGVPFMTIENTHQDFFWITNYLETVISSFVWGMINSATIANEFRELLLKYAEETGGDKNFVSYQAHDFSMRGMFSPMAALLSGMGHALSFQGSDSVPVLPAIQRYYPGEDNIISGVPATEHSIQCSYYTTKQDNELAYLDSVLNIHKKGIVSIVADGFDYWSFLTKTLPLRKADILQREGKVVIRPDSGNPADIICGFTVYNSKEQILGSAEALRTGVYVNDNKFYKVTVDGDVEVTLEEVKGSLELLWELFGGETNQNGFRILDSHIGLIYGDSITLDLCEEIFKRMKAKKFCSTNVVFGIGSFTYQFNTRDTFGQAIKATYTELENGEVVEYNTEAGELTRTISITGKHLFKEPKTGTGEKKSARGLVRVNRVNNEFILKDQCTLDEYEGGELTLLYEDGAFSRYLSFHSLRNTLKTQVYEELLINN